MIKIALIQFGSDEWKQAVKLRTEILRAPLGQTFTEQELLEEKNHHHIVVFYKNEIVGTAVLVPENHLVKMQRVAVVEKRRNSGIGAKILKFSESWCSENKISGIYCHARDSAVRFYVKNGYKAEGEYFDEDGIPHLKMTRMIQ